MNGGDAVSYEINYSGNRVQKRPIKRIGKRPRSLMKLLCIILVCLLGAVAFRDKAESFWRMTILDGSQLNSGTLSAFLEDVAYGDSVADVIAAFCESVLRHDR